MRTRTAVRGVFAGAAAAAAAYAGYAAVTWLRYGHGKAAHAQDPDQLLDRFMPVFEVADRHHITVNAPAPVTLAAATEMDLASSAVVRAIFRGRELVMGSRPGDRPRPRGLLEEVQALGWRILAEAPGREVVVGAVTKPWEPDVVFRPVPPGEFAAFAEPDYTKIVWTLRADPAGTGASVFHTETRATTTDARARAKFRLYWSCLSPGIRIIRMALLRSVKREAEARAARTWQEAAVS